MVLLVRSIDTMHFRQRSLMVTFIMSCTQGYARDVIDVVEDDTGKTVKALLYRGTPDNPAFWKRVLLDLPLAAGE